MCFSRCSRHSPRQVVAVLMGLLLLLIPLAGCGGSTSTNQTPTLVQFVSINLGLPARALNSPVVGQVPDDTRLHVVVTFKTNSALLDQLKKMKAGSGQSLNLKGLANQIGISDSTYEKVRAFFAIENVSLKLGDLHTTLTVDGKAGSFAKLFQTKFIYHQLDGRKFYAPLTPPQLPKFIADMIIAITGLESYAPAPQPDATFLAQHHLSTATLEHAAAACSLNSSVLRPAQIAHSYGYDQFWHQGFHGENMTVNLLELEGYDPNDVQNYLTCIGYKGQLTNQNVDVVPPPVAGHGESTLDIEMVAGMASAANINVYQADGNAAATGSDYLTMYNDILAAIVNDNANGGNGNVVSLSWSFPESNLTQNQMMAIDSNLQLLKAEQMTLFASTGDCGAFSSRMYNVLSVRFPASDPFSVGVGGTHLDVDGNGNRQHEVVWSDGSDHSACHNQWGSGGGLSIVYPRPTWQTGNGVNNQYSNGMREVPDISAVADNIADYVQGHWFASGGTSAATPIWAAGMALVNQVLIQQKNAVAFGSDLFYAVASSSARGQPFFDVTQGNNLYYSATPGYDLASGLGTPNLVDFYNTIASFPTS